MKLVLVLGLLSLALVAPGAGATPIHPKTCTSFTGACVGTVCATPDASREYICADLPIATQWDAPANVCTVKTGSCPGLACVAGDAWTQPVCVPMPDVQCLEFYNRVTVGPVTVTYGGCNAPTVQVDTSILA